MFGIGGKFLGSSKLEDDRHSKRSESREPGEISDDEEDDVQFKNLEVHRQQKDKRGENQLNTPESSSFEDEDEYEESDPESWEVSEEQNDGRNDQYLRGSQSSEVQDKTDEEEVPFFYTYVLPELLGTPYGIQSENRYPFSISPFHIKGKYLPSNGKIVEMETFDAILGLPREDAPSSSIGKFGKKKNFPHTNQLAAGKKRVPIRERLTFAQDVSLSWNLAEKGLEEEVCRNNRRRPFYDGWSVEFSRNLEEDQAVDLAKELWQDYMQLSNPGKRAVNGKLWVFFAIPETCRVCGCETNLRDSQKFLEHVLSQGHIYNVLQQDDKVITYEDDYEVVKKILSNVPIEDLVKDESSKNLLL